LGIPGVTTFLTFGRLLRSAQSKTCIQEEKKNHETELFDWLSMENHGRFVSWISMDKPIKQLCFMVLFVFLNARF